MSEQGPLERDLRRLHAAVEEVRDAMWAERHRIAATVGIVWLGLVLSILAFGPDWL